MARVRKQTSAAAGAGRIEITDENFGDMLIRGLEEAVAFEQGDRSTGRSRTVTAREATIAPPPAYTAKRVSQVRKRLALSQPVFANVLNVSPSTVRAWERGARVPDGPSLRLLEVAERHPEVLIGALSTKRDV